jgi:biotin carboxyl carrier protein
VASSGAGDVACPLSGRVVSIDCAAGQSVAVGDKLVTLEAMKMNTIVYAHEPGTVKEILVNAGDAVEEGQALLRIG